jgi:hypothetical protein
MKCCSKGREVKSSQVPIKTVTMACSAIFSQKMSLVTLTPQPSYRMASKSKKMAAERCVYIYFWTLLCVKWLPAENTRVVETFGSFLSLTFFLTVKTNNMFEQSGRQDISVGVAMSYSLDGRGSNPCRSKNFPLLHSVQISTGAQPSSSPLGTEGYFLEGKADHRLYYRGQEGRSNIFILPYIFVEWYVIT